MVVPLAVAASALFVLPLAPARAGGVMPGETVVVDAADFDIPSGDVVAEVVLPFSIEYEVNHGGRFVGGFDGAVAGTLTSAVIRDEQRGGTLSFVYDVDLMSDLDDADASDASILTVEGFESFKTDVLGALDFESVVLASRSDGGDRVRLSSDDPGLGGAPRLVIRTDATAYDQTGAARFLAGDELAVRTPDGLEVDFASGTAVVKGTFRPVFDDAPVPNPIPLPPALWSAIAAFGVARFFRAAKAR